MIECVERNAKRLENNRLFIDAANILYESGHDARYVCALNLNTC